MVVRLEFATTNGWAFRPLSSSGRHSMLPFSIHIVIGRSMQFVLQPWQLLSIIVAGWMNREQQQTIDYLRTENQNIRGKPGNKQILLWDGSVPAFGRQRQAHGC